MRILHTADWHLGQTLHGYSRLQEHQAFLDWLLIQLVKESIDILLIAGDLFDSANPPAASQAMYYSFLAAAHSACPNLEIVIIAGNHDSPSRLEASAPLLRSFNTHVIGSPRHMAIRLKEGIGCAAVPFLRPADLPATNHGNPLIEGVRQIYQQVVKELEGTAPILAMGHAYFVGGSLSELSERKVLGGNQHALPIDLFPPDITYVALGHLHRPQAVQKQEHIRYSGSPIPLSLDEETYPHQVLLIDLHSETQVRSITSLLIPSTHAIIRTAPLPLEELLTHLQQEDFSSNPYLELRVLLDKPEPHLRTTIAQALKHQTVKLCKITPLYTGTSPESPAAGPSLSAITPLEVFTRHYQKFHEGTPSKELLMTFHDLLEEAQQGDAL
jgi:exonuclease SbcD